MSTGHVGVAREGLVSTETSVSISQGVVISSYLGPSPHFGLQIIQTSRRPDEVPSGVSGFPPFSEVSREVLAISFLHLPDDPHGVIARIHE